MTPIQRLSVEPGSDENWKIVFAPLTWAEFKALCHAAGDVEGRLYTSQLSNNAYIVRKLTSYGLVARERIGETRWMYFITHLGLMTVEWNKKNSPHVRQWIAGNR